MTISITRLARQNLSLRQVTEVRAELSTILESDSFATSPRCRDFLECVVELSLSGDHESLTERFLGVKLFGRAVDYETATDSIVRVRANDVRRRLVQHYSNSGPEPKLRIEMAAGRYVTEFHWAPPIAEPAAPAGSPGPLTGSASLAGSEFGKAAPEKSQFLENSGWQSRRLIFTLAVIFLLTLGGLLIWLSSSKSSGFDAFWKPVLDAPGQPVLNLPTTDSFQLTVNPKRTLGPLNDLQPGQSYNLSYGDFIAYHDWHVSVPVLQATLAVTLALEHKGKYPLVRVGTDMRRDELRGHPVIAIGSFSNPWAQAAVNGLRFTFDRGESDLDPPRIRDSQNPQRTWSLTQTYPQPQTKDYAIITRTFDPVTGQPFVSLAGLHSFGNQMAGEFVSQESSWSEIARRAPRGWQKMNLQILLEGDVVGTTPGSPRIVDVYFWKQ